MSINGTGGLLTWANPTIGNYQVVVSAVDAGGLAAFQRFDLTVRANNEPVFQSTAPDKATPGVTYVYDVKAFDADGASLTYALDQTSLSKGMTIDALGRLRWTPTTKDITANPHQVVVTVRDDNQIFLKDNPNDNQANEYGRQFGLLFKSPRAMPQANVGNWFRDKMYDSRYHFLDNNSSRA